MTDEIINQAVNEVASPTPVEQAAVEPINSLEATKEENTTESTEPVDVPFPKKAVNLISRKEKKIWKLQASEAALKAELQKYKEQEAKAANIAPSESSFDNYGDYLEAKIKHGLKQEQGKTTEETSAKIPAEQTEWFNERASYAAQKASETAKQIPDYTATINDNLEFINSLPESISETLLEAENGGLALYTLAKEGRLFDLTEMSERAAAMLIAKAEVRGANYLKKQTTQTPAPIGGLKGVGQSNKAISGQSEWGDLKKWLNS